MLWWKTVFWFIYFASVLIKLRFSFLFSSLLLSFMTRIFRFTCCLCRSQSRHVDVEKPKKKKTLSTPTSLVSIPNTFNTIKLSMLNSGLLSFGKLVSTLPFQSSFVLLSLMSVQTKRFAVLIEIACCKLNFYLFPFTSLVLSVDKVKLSVKGEQ